MTLRSACPPTAVWAASTTHEQPPYVLDSLIDPAAIQRFWDLGIGVYSDEPFPPLNESATDVQMPSFSSKDAAPPV